MGLTNKLHSQALQQRELVCLWYQLPLLQKMHVS